MDILSLYFDGSKLEIARVKKRKASFIIEILHSEPLPIKDVKQLYKSIENSKKCLTASAIACDKVLIKPLNIKASNLKTLKKILPFQIDSVSHLKEEDSIYVPVLSKKEKQSFDLVCFLTSKHFISEILQNMRDYKFELDVLSTVSMALVRFSQCFFNQLLSAFILHIGRAESCLVYMSNQVALASYCIPIGAQEIKSSLKAGKNKIDLSHIDETKTDPLTLTLKKWKMEFAKIFSILPKKTEKHPLLITGQYDFSSDLKQYFFQDYSDHISTILQDPEEENYPHFKKYAISIGLAIDALSKDSRSIQFLQKEFMPGKIYKRFTKKLLVFSFLFLSCLASLFISMQTFEKKKLHSLQKKLESYVAQDENLTDRKIFFTKQDLSSKVEKWEKTLKQEAASFPYIVTTTNVHETLSWLFQHPLVKEKKIHLENFTYNLVSYPKLKESKESYKVQISCEIKANDPSTAKSFYHCLFNEKKLIDPDREITFEEYNKKFKTTFFLRKKQS